MYRAALAALQPGRQTICTKVSRGRSQHHVGETYCCGSCTGSSSARSSIPRRTPPNISHLEIVRKARQSGGPRLTFSTDEDAASGQRVHEIPPSAWRSTRATFEASLYMSLLLCSGTQVIQIATANRAPAKAGQRRFKDDWEPNLLRQIAQLRRRLPSRGHHKVLRVDHDTLQRVRAITQ